MVNKITTPPTTSELIGTVNEIIEDKQDVISDLATIRSGAALGATALQPNDNISELTNNVGYITGITSSDVTTALGYTPYNSSNPSNYQTSTQVANSIATETTNRENADNNLQSQIDAIVSSSDVFDIVGTYAELQAYDITTVPVNDIIKVLVDSTHSDAATYYRCVETGGVKSWSYIGSEGAYYTKAEADAAFVPQTRTVNNKALSANITLTASDVGALPSSTVIPTVNNPTITITQGGVSKGSFTLNQATGDTIALDAGGGSTYTAGTGIDITSNVISVKSPTLTNTATASSSLTISSSNPTTSYNAINIGGTSIADDQGCVAIMGNAYGWASTAIGYGAQAYGTCSVCVGSAAKIDSSITTPTHQIGRGTNSEAGTLYVGFGNMYGEGGNYKLLDGATGLIPSARIAIDGTSITVNSSGQLQASGGGASVEAFTAAEVQTIWESV